MYAYVHACRGFLSSILAGLDALCPRLSKEARVWTAQSRSQVYGDSLPSMTGIAVSAVYAKR